jgi:hypothetical protein
MTAAAHAAAAPPAAHPPGAAQLPAQAEARGVAPVPTRAEPPTMVAAWARVRADFERTKFRLGALLANAHVLELEGGRVSLGFSDRSDVDAAEKARAEIEQALSTEMGSPVRLAIGGHQPGQGGGAAPVIRAQVVEDADAVASDRRRREQEARQHPIVQKAQDLFGAAIREIKT